MKFSDLFKNPKVAKAVDEAMGDMNTEATTPVKGFVSVDEFAAGMKGVSDKLDAIAAGMKPGKDASTQPTASQPAEVKAKDADEPAAASGEGDVNARMDRLEAKLDAVLAKMSGEGAAADEESEVVTDEDGDDDDETGDESCDEAYGDEDDLDDEDGVLSDTTAARMEILAPGKKFKGKDAKAKALDAAYATKDGKAVINRFTGGKKPDLKNQAFVDSTFVAASELLKVKRNSEFASTRTRTADNTVEHKGDMTPEKLNQLNDKHYASKSTH